MVLSYLLNFVNKFSWTDSLIYYAKDGDYEPDLGNYLGDLTNEISTEQLICVSVSQKVSLLVGS